MNMINVLLNILAISAIISAIMVITTKNPVISVLFLVSVFINSACYLLVLGVGFVGLSYLIIYVGAITVLFLFVIMMINIQLVDLLEVGSAYTQNLPLGFILIGLFFYEIMIITPINLNYDSISILPFWILNNLNSLFLLSNSYLNTMNWNFLFLGLEKGVLPSFETLSDGALFTLLQVEMLGQTLYTYSFILLLIMGLILFLGMLGPIVLTLSSSNKK